MMLIITGCTNDLNSSSEQIRTQSPEIAPLIFQEQENVMVYFATLDGKNLVPVTLSINPTKEGATIALEKLLAGPENNFSLETIPKGTKIKNIYLQDEIVYVDLTKNINKVAPDKAEMAIESLIMTLTEFKGINAVQILIDGQTQEKLGDINIDKPVQRLAVINNYGGKGKNLVKVYFSDANAMYLVPVTVNVPDDNLPLAALKELVKGPADKSGLMNTLWSGTRINNLTVQDGIASVDFSSEVLGYGGGATAETMLINSVVLTLTEFEDIDAVQFLINGEKIEFLPEGSDISSPIPAPQNINFIQF